MPRYTYTPHPQFPVGMPLVEIQLARQANVLNTLALVDSGAALNVLPFDLGIQLGLDWKRQNFPLELGGALTGTQAFAVLLSVQLAPFAPVDLAFAWVARSSNQVRLLLGQINFFQRFDVHFYGNEQVFDIELRQSQ